MIKVGDFVFVKSKSIGRSSKEHINTIQQVKRLEMSTAKKIIVYIIDGDFYVREDIEPLFNISEDLFKI